MVAGELLCIRFGSQHSWAAGEIRENRIPGSTCRSCGSDIDAYASEVRHGVNA